jgi:hypothetical protein
MGKDVMWLPTSAQLVTTMLTAARVTADDLVVDLGAGDGIIPILAAQQFGAALGSLQPLPLVALLNNRALCRLQQALGAGPALQAALGDAAAALVLEPGSEKGLYRWAGLGHPVACIMASSLGFADWQPVCGPGLCGGGHSCHY